MEKESKWSAEDWLLRACMVCCVFVVAVGVINCGGPEEPTSGESLVKPSLLNKDHMLSSAELVDCTLEDGTQTKCYSVQFKSNPEGHGGPYCPKTKNDIAGLGIYDGKTNPGFQLLAATLWDAMEADGFDILDDEGNVKIVAPMAGGPGGADGGMPPMDGGPPGGPPGGTAPGAACLEATPNDSVKLTFLIPANPVMLDTPNQIDSVELIGLSLNGVPMNGDPPTVAGDSGGRPGGGGAIPALDPCGGHIDPAGYYHWHFGASVINEVLQANNITEVTCQAVIQSTTALLGFAKDGHPIYASKDMDGADPTDLDTCQGHTAATKDYPDGVYHYHVSAKNTPNLPRCLKGAAAQNAFTRQ